MFHELSCPSLSDNQVLVSKLIRAVTVHDLKIFLCIHLIRYVNSHIGNLWG